MGLSLQNTPIKDVYLFQSPAISTDDRGHFWKLFQGSEFKDAGFASHFPESYVTTSKAGVFRGLHFQLPPEDHAKVVTCLQGHVIDYVLDLRKASDTYGKACALELSEENKMSVYIPKGCAHGFYVPGPREAMLLYNVGTEYAPEQDAGLHWKSLKDSLEIAWEPEIMSARDREFIPLTDFQSPF